MALAGLPGFFRWRKEGIDQDSDRAEKLADEDNGWHFLVDRLREQHDKAPDAFNRIFKLGQYSEQAAARKKADLRASVEGLVDAVASINASGAKG